MKIVAPVKWPIDFLLIRTMTEPYARYPDISVIRTMTHSTYGHFGLLVLLKLKKNNKTWISKLGLTWMSLEFDLQCVPFDKSSNSDYWVHSIVEWSRNTLNQQLDSSNTISQNIRFLIDKGKFLFVFASRLKCMNVV